MQQALELGISCNFIWSHSIVATSQIEILFSIVLWLHFGWEGKDQALAYNDLILGYHEIIIIKVIILLLLSLDQVINQTLMRSLKSTEGFTRGTDFQDAQGNTCSEIRVAIQEFTRTNYGTSNHQKRNLM